MSTHYVVILCSLAYHNFTNGLKSEDNNCGQATESNMIYSHHRICNRDCLEESSDCLEESSLFCGNHQNHSESSKRHQSFSQLNSLPKAREKVDSELINSWYTKTRQKVSEEQPDKQLTYIYECSCKFGLVTTMNSHHQVIFDYTF